METNWLEDFVSLVETRSFSRSAQLRHITQPAFSRRIQALESWAGVDLIDRSSYPTRMTPAGETLYQQAIELLQSVQSARAMLRGHSTTAHDVVEFAVPHTLAFTFFPHWLSALRGQFGPLKSRLIALNVHDAVMRLAEGACDLLIAYHHPSQPFQLSADGYEWLSLGQEVVAPYACANGNGQPLHLLPGKRHRPLPYLGYASGAYMARMVELILKGSHAAVHLERVYETDMAEGLKAMAKEGHGIAFLPSSAVKADVQAGRLVSAAPPELKDLQLTMDIRIYRALPSAPGGDRAAVKRKSKSKSGSPSKVNELWAHLASQSPPAS